MHDKETERRSKISRARTGIPHTEETRAKIAAALKGHVVSEEVRSKMAAAKTGRKLALDARITAIEDALEKIEMALDHFSKQAKQ